MKIFLQAFLLVIALTASGGGCSQKKDTVNSKGSSSPTSLSADDFATMFSASNEAILLDVRTDEEFNGEHLRGAINVNYNSSEFTDQLSILDKSKHYFVYCQRGGRSNSAANEMRSAGFSYVTELDGGLNAWKSAGLSLELPELAPIENPTPATPATDLRNLTSVQYANLISGPIPVLVDFNAPWCGPCKKIAPFVAELEKKYEGKLKVLSINVDENPELSSVLKIASIPQLFIFKDGKKVWDNLGYIERDDLFSAVAKNL